MAKLVLVNLDLQGGQILGLRAEMLGADPTGDGLYEGRLWINSSTHLLKYYNGSATLTLGGGVSSLTVDGASLENLGTSLDPVLRVQASGITNAMLAGAIANTKLATDPLVRSNHTGTQLAATISDLDAAVHTSRLDQLATPNTAVALGGQKITGLANGAAGTDAINLSQLQAAQAGYTWKDPVRASTVNGGSYTLSTSFEEGDTLDGVVLAAGNRILLKDMATGSQNGIYTVNASGAPTRATDADTGAELEAGVVTLINEGTLVGTTWRQSTTGTITLGTTALTWQQVGQGGQIYTAGTGLSLVGNTFSLTSPVPILNGGTGATTAAAGLAALGGVGKYAVDIGNGSATSFVLTHGLAASRDQHVTVYRNSSPWDVVLCDVEMTSTTTITLRFAVAPTSAQYRAVVVG